jgi:hypothetical protein
MAGLLGRDGVASGLSFDSYDQDGPTVAGIPRDSIGSAVAWSGPQNGEVRMSTQDEAVWRGALERRGRDWVMRELQTRAGQPEDPLLDVTYEPPHPTREFCVRWCGERGRGFRVSGTGLAMVVLVVVLMMGGMLAVSSWDNARIAAHRTAMMR